MCAPQKTFLFTPVRSRRLEAQLEACVELNLSLVFQLSEYDATVNKSQYELPKRKKKSFRRRLSEFGGSDKSLISPTLQRRGSLLQRRGSLFKSNAAKKSKLKRNSSVSVLSFAETGDHLTEEDLRSSVVQE